MISLTRSPPSGDDVLAHAALFYSDPPQLRRAAADVLAAASDHGEPVLAVLPAPNLELLGDVLERDAPHATVHDMYDVGRNPARLLALVEEWLERQPGPARILSEPMWPQRSAAATTECLRHEALLNDALAATAASVLCPFDAARLAADVLAGAEMTHPQVIDEAGPRPSRTYGDPLTMAAGGPWPQSEPATEVTEHAFDGDLYGLRRALAADPLLAGLRVDRREDLVFSINEVVTNAVLHGDGSAHTRLWRTGDTVVCEVSSATTIADPYAGRRRPDAAAPDGRGLWLINQLCDCVELRSTGDGTRVRLHVDSV